MCGSVCCIWHACVRIQEATYAHAHDWLHACLWMYACFICMRVWYIYACESICFCVCVHTHIHINLRTHIHIHIVYGLGTCPKYARMFSSVHKHKHKPCKSLFLYTCTPTFMQLSRCMNHATIQVHESCNYPGAIIFPWYRLDALVGSFANTNIVLYSHTRMRMDTWRKFSFLYNHC